MSRSVADGDLINAVRSQDSGSKTLEKEFSDKEIVTKTVCWAEAANAYYAVVQLAKRRPCS